MADISIDRIKKQLTSTEQEFEEVRAQLYRLDGIIRVLKHFIENPTEAEVPAPVQE